MYDFISEVINIRHQNNIDVEFKNKYQDASLQELIDELTALECKLFTDERTKNFKFEHGGLSKESYYAIISKYRKMYRQAEYLTKLIDDYRVELNREFQDYFCTYLDKMGLDDGTDKHEYQEHLAGYKVNNIIYRPYNWNDDYDTRPNFENKDNGLKIWWYKHPLRGAECNFDIETVEKLKELIGDK